MNRFISISTRMRGLSLVELMIAMTLGLATVGTVGWIYLGTTQTYRTQDALARLQEGARYAFEVISNDLRMTGTTGCGSRDKLNVLQNYTTDWYKNLLEQPLMAVEKDGAAGSLTEFSDALEIVRADVGNENIVQAHNAGGSQFTFTATHNISAGDLLVATDCTQVSVFQASGVGSTTTVQHAATGQNTTPLLGTGPSGTPITLTFSPGSRVYRVISSAYYIDTNPAGEPALYRTRPVGAALTLTPEELIEGVEDLQVTFGVDTDGTPDGAPNPPYRTAAQITSVAGGVPGATQQDRWSRVVSVRISLLMRSPENNVVASPQTYSFNGAPPVVAPDRRLRKVFTHVVKLRKG